MFIFRPLAKKRNLVWALCCIVVFYLFIGFLRLISFSFRGRYLTVELVNVNPISIYYNELWPVGTVSKKDLLTVTLLYTKSMTAHTWEHVGTPEMLQAAGYRVLCVHLPVISEGIKEPSYPLKGEILSNILEQLDALNCVLIAPSKTGSYAMPVVLRGGHPLRGFVAISPSDTQQFTSKEYRILQTLTLILQGSNDQLPPSLDALENLKQIPNKEVVELQNAGHDCYVDQPDTFHRVLLNYLKSIKHSLN